MKLLFTGLIVMALLFVGYKALRPPAEPPVLGTYEVETPDELSEHELMINLNDKEYKVVWIKVDANTAVLLPNFEKKAIAKDLYEDNACKVLINGGFYTADDEVNSPIGLFISDGEYISEYKTNSLFNGILSINSLGTPRITEKIPEDSLLSAMQTGPILQENDFEHELSLVRDKEARRMAAAITGDNELVFLSVYNDSSSFYGPELTDMPKIISLFEEKANLNIADAINLDGGAASAFYAEGVNISEASPIGSFWCVK